MRQGRFLYLAACAVVIFAFTPVLPSDDAEPPESVEQVAEGEAETEGLMSPAQPGQEDKELGLAEILGGTSGVRVATMCTNCNIAGVTMCGQTDERVQVWKDGLPVMGGLGAIYLLSVMPSEGIENSAVVTGAGTVLSGSEASAGALVINTQVPEKRPTLYTAFDFGSLDWASQELLASGQLGRWGGGLVVTRARSDPSDIDDDDNFELGAFERETIGGTVTIDITRNSRLRLDALSYSEDQRGNKGGHRGGGISDFYRENVVIDRTEYALAWNHRFPDDSRLTLAARQSRREQDTWDDSSDPSVPLGAPYMLVDEETRSAEARYERFLAQRHLFTAGAVYRKLEVDGEIIKDPYQRLHDFIRHEGIFAEVELALPHRLNLTAGLRHDEYDWTPGRDSFPPVFPVGPTVRSRVSPRARLAWRATHELSLGFSAGYGFAAPRPAFERICCGGKVESNAGSAAEVSLNFLLDADYVPFRWLRLKASLFRNDFEDFLQKMTVRTAPDYIPTFAPVNFSEFALDGVTFSTELRHLDHLSYGLELTHLHTSSDDPIAVSHPRNRERYVLNIGQIPFHPKDQGSAFVRWDDPGRGLKLSAQAQYTGSMYVQFLARTVGTFRGTFFETPSFWVYNFRAEKRVHPNVSIFAGVDNASDEVQDFVNDPQRWEYNWGPLRGRYYYGGVAFNL